MRVTASCNASAAPKAGTHTIARVTQKRSMDVSSYRAEAHGSTVSLKNLQSAGQEAHGTLPTENAVEEFAGASPDLPESFVEGLPVEVFRGPALHEIRQHFELRLRG